MPGNCLRKCQHRCTPDCEFRCCVAPPRPAIVAPQPLPRPAVPVQSCASYCRVPVFLTAVLAAASRSTSFNQLHQCYRRLLR
ncbi:hypothetical protein OS493_029727 [Desmophyllum pertusum]|uniref:Uncharacterized protein n=1 Tax=Desmophyllum pertusum TaxID=174260 RepID=A0A9X0CWX1_9CNID|nr:hypothetical protein OS493_029727 [Desmophyllum pertusum]